MDIGPDTRETAIRMPPLPPPNDSLPRNGGHGPSSLARHLICGLSLGGLWAILAGFEDPMSWLVGLPTVIIASWFCVGLSPRWDVRLSILGILRLLVVFFWESFRGGIDVARRVLRIRPEVDPGLFDYKLSLSSMAARVLFIDLVSLLPGTLSADLRGDRMQIHSLDLNRDAVSELARLERYVAAVFCQSLSGTEVEAR